MRGLWQDLQPAPDRLGGTLRITVSALLVTAVMLTFRMPFLYIGPYLVFILSQRDTFLTRAAAALGLVVALVASLIIYLVAWLAWDTGWLRVSLWGLIFFGGYFFMRISVEPRAVLGPLVVVALFSFAFDEVPDPNRVVSLVGWLWAILGLIVAATFLTQWLFHAPTSLELLRREFREVMIGVERDYLARAFGRTPQNAQENFEDEETAQRIEKLGLAGVLSPSQAHCTGALLGAAFGLRSTLSESRPHDDQGPLFRALAQWTRRLRGRVLSGPEAPGPGPFPPIEALEPPLREASARLRAAALLLENPEVPERRTPSLLVPDWKTNPVYADFALRATLATMACYFFMSLTAWDGIHTCLITCAVTALAGADERTRKQNLRMAGALIGGLLGMGAVIFVIPHMESLFSYLAILAAGTALAAWVSLGSERISYAGWQIALAFYMTILQDPHPTTKLDIIRDRWVGIFVGILAMRAAFVWLAPKENHRIVVAE